MRIAGPASRSGDMFPCQAAISPQSRVIQSTNKALPARPPAAHFEHARASH